MLLQASAPRPVMNPVDSPEHFRIQTLRRPGVSDGGVLFSFVSDLESGSPTNHTLAPVESYQIEGQDGFEALDYWLPFDTMFKESGLSDLALAALSTSGYRVTVRSAFRSDRTKYEERVISLLLLTPVTGGGVIRLGDSFFDIANPTLNPRAPTPKRVRDETISIAFNRAHKVLTQGAQDAIEARRRARIAEAEANMQANTRALEGRDRRVKALPPKKP